MITCLARLHRAFSTNLFGLGYFYALLDDKIVAKWGEKFLCNPNKIAICKLQFPNRSSEAFGEWALVSPKSKRWKDQDEDRQTHLNERFYGGALVRAGLLSVDMSCRKYDLVLVQQGNANVIHTAAVYREHMAAD